MARLPIPGGDENTWGAVLNDFLSAAHNSDGSIKDTAVTGLAGQPVSTTTPTDTQVLAYNATSQQWEPTAAGGAPDATTTSKGIVQLAGDLGGTAAAPTVPGLADKADTSDLTAHASDTTSVHGIADTADLETAAGAQAKVDTHNADTTGVHGISDTSVLETTTGAQAKVDTHSADTTSVHGIANTANLETTAGAQAKVDAHAADATIHSSGREIAYAQITSNQTNIATTGINIADVTGLTVTIPAGGVRPIYLTAVVHVTNETSGGRCVIGIAPSSATNGFQIIQGGGVRIQTALDAAELYVEVRLAAGTSGAYKVVAQTPDYVPPVDPDPPTHRMNVVGSVLTPSIFKAVEA